jgi:DNA-binding NarL/FixJ family response regulator
VLPVRLVLADDHEIMRVGLRDVLLRQVNWIIVGEVADGEAAAEMVLALEPDVAVMDIAMPKLNGLEAARLILSHGSRTKILLLSAHDSPQIISEVLDSGAKGFVLKSEAARDLVAAVEAVRAGETFFTPKVAGLVLERHWKRVKKQADKADRAIPMKKS